MESKLRNIDFSRFSKVQNSLKRELMMKYDNRKQLLSDEDLDLVAAARKYPQGTFDEGKKPWEK